MIIYHSKRGRIEWEGVLYPAYSGFHEGKNAPTQEKVRGIGPIPAGDWAIDHWDDQHGDKGPQVAVLRPVGHDAHGRTAFLIHGDSKSDPGNASHGCIIAARNVRDMLRASKELHLRVIAD